MKPRSYRWSLSWVPRKVCDCSSVWDESTVWQKIPKTYPGFLMHRYPLLLPTWPDSFVRSLKSKTSPRSLSRRMQNKNQIIRTARLLLKLSVELLAEPAALPSKR